MARLWDTGTNEGRITLIFFPLMLFDKSFNFQLNVLPSSSHSTSSQPPPRSRSTSATLVLDLELDLHHARARPRARPRDGALWRSTGLVVNEGSASLSCPPTAAPGFAEFELPATPRQRGLGPTAIPTHVMDATASGMASVAAPPRARRLWDFAGGSFSGSFSSCVVFNFAARCCRRRNFA